MLGQSYGGLLLPVRRVTSDVRRRRIPWLERDRIPAEAYLASPMDALAAAAGHGLAHPLRPPCTCRRAEDIVERTACLPQRDGFRCRWGNPHMPADQSSQRAVSRSIPVVASRRRASRARYFAAAELMSAHLRREPAPTPRHRTSRSSFLRSRTCTTSPQRASCFAGRRIDCLGAVRRRGSAGPVPVAMPVRPSAAPRPIRRAAPDEINGPTT